MIPFVEYSKNTIGKDYVVGDIHGCFSDLYNFLDKLKFNKETDRLFSVGDLTDRGPESEKALEIIKEPWFFPVLGNHEDMLLICYRDKAEDESWHIGNGGHWAWNGTCKDSDLDDYCKRIAEFPLIIKIDNVLILHSLLPKEVTSIQVLKDLLASNYEVIKEYILWERNPIYNHKLEEDISIIAGHTIVKEPTTFGCILDIDTGAFLKYWGREGKLTIVELE